MYDEPETIHDIKAINWIQGWIVEPWHEKDLALILRIEFNGESTTYTLIHLLSESESSHIAPSVPDLERLYTSRDEDGFYLHIVHPEYGGEYLINDCIGFDDNALKAISNPSFISFAYSNKR